MSLLLSLIAAIAVAQNPIELNHKVYVAGIPVAKTTFGEKSNITYLSVVPKKIPIKWLPEATYWQTKFLSDSLRYIVNNETIATGVNDSSSIERLVREAMKTKNIQEEITPLTLHRVISYLIENADNSKYTVSIILDRNNNQKKAKKVLVQVGTPVIPDSTDFKELNDVLKDDRRLVPVTFEPAEGEFIEKRFFVETATIFYNGIGPVAALVGTKLVNAKVILDSYTK